jgi:predicted RNA binding protein YcfA (HicA-like mRNA interferase family)
MPKIPRDISGKELSKLLNKYQYQIARESGSHIRLISTYQKTEHKITIPDHH